MKFGMFLAIICSIFFIFSKKKKKKNQCIFIDLYYCFSIFYFIFFVYFLFYFCSDDYYFLPSANLGIRLFLFFQSLLFLSQVVYLRIFIFLIQAIVPINFPFCAAFAASYMFQYFFLFVFICLKILSNFSFDIFFGLLVVQECIAYFPYIFEFFSFLLFLISSFIALCFESTLTLISVFSNLLRLGCDLKCDLLWRMVCLWRMVS